MKKKTFDGVNYITIKKDGRFTNPGETYSNQRLYISAIFGSPSEDGMPILDNACTVWTPYGAKYTFFDPIKINVVDEKCENEAYYVAINITGGLGGLSPNRAYRSVSDGINIHTNVSVGEVVTFGPYQGESEYYITAKGAKGCEAAFTGTYNCGGANRKASITSRSSGIFEINYTDPNFEIESVQVFNMNGQIVPANIQINNNGSEIELKNQLKGSIYFVQLLVTDSKTNQSFLVSEKIYKN